jgi:uncharacterized protein (DUF1499 family)
MRRMVVLLGWFALAVVAALAVATVAVGPKGMWALVFGPVVREPVEFDTLVLRPSPNQYLVAPQGLCGSAQPHAESPVFGVTPDELRDRWMTRIAALPLVEPVGARPEIEQYDFEVLTPLLRFPDTVTVRFLPAGDGGSTLAVYSRSHYGYSDLGANEQRVDDWLARLAEP